ncbi:MAG: M23 family metallopeptidase, partial [Microbacterium sp.]
MTILWPNGQASPPNFSAEGHFGWRKSSAPGASRYHRGLDMWGLGTVHAIADGTVVAVGWGAGYGWGGGYQVWIQHDGYFTRSLHLVDGSALVSVGDRVTAGQAIGTEGATGAVQKHLHLEITPGQWHAYNSGQIDPKAWLLENVGGSGSA